ncbi:MAG: adenylate/guanylate cyclase domain-containing protein [Pseudomonadota bacterium]
MFNFFKPWSHKKVPKRVYQALQRQDRYSQQLIAGASMLLALVFSALFLIDKLQRQEAPKIFDLVPWILGIYFLFSCIRVIFALRDHTPKWFLVVDSFIDIALLMVLIWSFHLSYDQPSGFVLKTPTLLYVFIFIALRAFRFEALYVLISGLTAFVGWLAIVLFVFWVDESTIVTKNYVEYMTSNALLLGAEFDKLITILLVSVILSLVILRANRTLHEAVYYESAQHELSRFFDDGLAARISDGNDEMKAGSGELVEALVLNLDIRGFTNFSSNLPPDQVIRLLCDYQKVIVPIIHKYKGNVDKFLGDGLMATFGAVIPEKAADKNAMLAIEEIMEKLDEWNAGRLKNQQTEVNVNMALTRGLFILGVVGSENRLEYTSIGDAVNLSAKLEKYNKILKTRALCCHASWQKAKEQGYDGKLNGKINKNCMIEGVNKPIDVVQLELMERI